jgi:hypothetical protein
MALTDFTFVPDGGSDSDRLSRHPRNRSVWGLDVHSLDVAGMWTLRFEIDGPQGPAPVTWPRRAQVARAAARAELSDRPDPSRAGVLRRGVGTNRVAQQAAVTLIGGLSPRRRVPWGPCHARGKRVSAAMAQHLQIVEDAVTRLLQ